MELKPTAKPTSLRLLKESVAELQAAQDDVTSKVLNARRCGASWEDIGQLLGITKQRAHQRYSAAARDRSRDDQYTPAENAEADQALAALQAVAASKIVDEDRAGDSITPSIFLEPKAPAKPATKLKRWTPESPQETYIDNRPKFYLENAGRIDGVAQPGIGKGPHNCPRCKATNHKGETDLIRAYPGECKPTKYDPRDIAAWLTTQEGAK